MLPDRDQCHPQPFETGRPGLPTKFLRSDSHSIDHATLCLSVLLLAMTFLMVSGGPQICSSIVEHGTRVRVAND